MTNPLLTFHKFDPENYEKHVYEALTSARETIPVYPNAGKLTNLRDGSDFPLDRVYMVRILTEEGKYPGVDTTWDEQVDGEKENQEASST